MSFNAIVIGVSLIASDYLLSCQEEVDNNIGTLATILEDQKLCSGIDASVVRDAYDAFGLLSFAFDTRLDLHCCKF